MHLYIAKFWNLIISDWLSNHLCSSNIRNCWNICVVANTSAIALCALVLVILKYWQSISRRLLGKSGSNLLANFLVHKIELLMERWQCNIPLWLRNQWSKVALWATRIWSCKKSKKLGNASAILGASWTIKSSIPVKRVIKWGMGLPGLTKVWKLFNIVWPSNNTAAISVIRLVSLLSQVVSISTII